MMKLFSFSLLLFAVSALPAAPSWIWLPDRSRSAAFRKTVTLDEEVRSAVFHIACDGRALLYVNGKLPFRGTDTPWLNLAVLKVQRYDLGKAFTKGENVFAVTAWPGEHGAGFICKGEIVLKSGRTVTVDSGPSFLVFDRESLRVPGEELWQSRNPSGWNLPGGDFSHWKPAKVLGPAEHPSYRDRVDTAPLRRDDCFSAAPEKQGRLMLDDFSDISSWLGGPRRGHAPAATRPVHFSFGSVPAPERDDGFCGELRFAFREKNGVATFIKNAVYQTWSRPAAITFAADPAGRDGALSFEFEDKAGKRFRTAELAVSGSGWKNYTLPFDRTTVPEFDRLAFPVAMRSLQLRLREPGNGVIRLDDIAYLADVSNPRKQLEIRSEYRQLAHAPGERVRLGFRVRNALARSVECRFELRVFSPEGELLRRQRASAEIGAASVQMIRFDLDGFSRIAPYRIELAADNGSVRNTFQGWLGVFRPNGRRLNHGPMYFGIEDQEFHTAPYEAGLHVEWMKLLGVDLLRGIFMGGAAQYERGAQTGLEAFAKLWQPHFDAGLELLLDYAADVPPWTISDANKKNDPNWHRNRMSDLPEMLAEHIADVAKFIAVHPQIRYFEWLNEPDLGGFGGTADEYIASLKLVYPILKQYAPQLKVTTGGMVVTHPYGKPGFTRRVYRECAGFYDVAAFHCHDDIETYKRYQAEIEKLAPGKPVANTEAGSRSYQSAPELFFIQAAVLVKKIAYAKSRGSEFYIWFMLQDYWDKYVNADDSFGLVTVDNQPKPSFLAYNELIRRLAGLAPAPAAELDPRLETLRFTGKEREVFVCWPRQDSGNFLFALRSGADVVRTDIFGSSETIRPRNGIAMLTSSALPFYLSAPPGAVSPGIQPLTPRGRRSGIPGGSCRCRFTLTNPLPEAARLELAVNGRKLARRLEPGASADLELPLTIPADALPGTVAKIPARLRLGETEQPAELEIAVALPVPPAGTPPHPLRLDSAAQLTELAFDPVTPRWSGPDDLSATIRINHDMKNLLFDIEVRDQEHCTPFDGDRIWKNDSIQVALSPEDGKQVTELTVSGSTRDRAAVWRHRAPDAAQEGRWPIQAEVVRDSGVTRYRFAVPLAETGIPARPGTRFRLSLLVNDNDGGKRLRLMEFSRGIENDKSSELFGRAELQ